MVQTKETGRPLIIVIGVNIDGNRKWTIVLINRRLILEPAIFGLNAVHFDQRPSIFG